MFKIAYKKRLRPMVTRMDIRAPDIAAKVEPGQFIMLRVDRVGEYIPITVADFDRKSGTVAVIFQIAGAETYLLNQKHEGDTVFDFLGPFGMPFCTDGFNRAAIVSAGIGCASAYPIARKLCENGTVLHTVSGFRTKELVILEDEFRALSDIFHLFTDDGSRGERGSVTSALEKLMETWDYDGVIAIGSAAMMRSVSELTKERGIKTAISMSAVMADGAGMCAGCRVAVGGEIKFACVDGPGFDGHLVDFDRLTRESAICYGYETPHKCRLSMIDF